MRITRTCAFAGIGALAILVTAPLSAQAATTGDTTTTFTISGGALTITVPAAADLGSTSAGSVVSAKLGTVTVNDQRAVLAGGWTVTASSGAFTTGGGTSNETIPRSAATYLSGIATGTTGSAVFAPGQATTPAGLTSSLTAFSASATVGNNSVSWNPTVAVAVPAQAVAGSYTGTITHSVS